MENHIDNVSKTQWDNNKNIKEFLNLSGTWRQNNVLRFLTSFQRPYNVVQTSCVGYEHTI